MTKTQVCEEAVQLYDYMVHKREVSIRASGDIEDLLVFKVYVSNFIHKYEIWLKELENAGWIKSDIVEDKEALKVFVLGKTKTVYFRDSGDLEKEKLLSHYDTQQVEVIEKVLSAIGSLRKSGTLTEKQTLAELKYFDKYSCEVIIRSAQVYLNLPIDKQHGERYLRGIIRNEEAQSNGRLQKSELSATSPIASHIEVQNKNDWVRKNIDSDLFVSMNDDDQAKYLQQLESDYESARKS